MEIVVDVVLALAAVVAIVSGWRRGALLTAASMVGLIGGLWIGLLIAPAIVEGFTTPSSSATQRTVIAAVTVLICAAIVYGLASTLAVFLRRWLGKGVARGLDAAGGSIVGLVAWAAAIWLIAGFVQSTSLYPMTQYAASSKIVTALDSMAPVPASTALGALDEALATAGLPEVFTGPESIKAAPAPDATVPDAVNAESESVLKVTAYEPGCGTESTGSGWVLSHNRVVTNAHVVAGSTTTMVQIHGTGPALPATVVAFDPDRDVAILDVPDLDAAPLKLGAQLAAGASSEVAGYPGGGPYTVGTARVRTVQNATGTDIYKRDTVVRAIYSLRAVVRPGDSGGPLFDTSGKVVGIVFARSSVDPNTGYALTLGEAAPVLQKAGSTVPVTTGSCSAD